MSRPAPAAGESASSCWGSTRKLNIGSPCVGQRSANAKRSEGRAAARTLTMETCDADARRDGRGRRRILGSVRAMKPFVTTTRALPPLSPKARRVSAGSHLLTAVELRRRTARRGRLGVDACCRWGSRILLHGFRGGRRRGVTSAVAAKDKAAGPTGREQAAGTSVSMFSYWTPSDLTNLPYRAALLLASPVDGARESPSRLGLRRSPMLNVTPSVVKPPVAPGLPNGWRARAVGGGDAPPPGAVGGTLARSTTVAFRSSAGTADSAEALRPTMAPTPAPGTMVGMVGLDPEAGALADLSLRAAVGVGAAGRAGVVLVPNGNAT